MYLAVDIGGTKTLLAAFTQSGKIHASRKFDTPKIYAQFLKLLAENVAALDCDFLSGVVAAPGKINRDNGVVLAFGNLDWKNIPLRDDVEDIAHCPMHVENDTKLAGLSEAIYIKDEFKNETVFGALFAEDNPLSVQDRQTIYDWLINLPEEFYLPSLQDYMNKVEQKWQVLGD